MKNLFMIMLGICGLILFSSCEERKEIVNNNIYSEKLETITNGNTHFEVDNIDSVIAIYKRISQYPPEKDSIKNILLQKINSLEVIYEVGKVYYDDFTKDHLRNALKIDSITFSAFLLYTKTHKRDKFWPEKVYVITSETRKQNELYKKHPDWSKDECITVAKHHVKIGMNKEMCIAAWGRPEDINRSVGSWGTHEQWVYGSRNYLYLENGILTSWQN
jgi:hypothetical protein